jgi:protease-4
MSLIDTASAILQGRLLINPQYAHAHLPLLLQRVKDQVSDRGALYNIRMERSSEMASVIPGRRALAAATSMPVFSVSPYTSVDRLPYESIVMIDILGPVYKYGSWYSWGSVELTELIYRMSNSEKVKGFILNIDSPGGQAAGTADFAAAIRLVSRIKPVIAIVQDGMAASAAMWIASAAQEIYVTQPTDQVGSIGAYQTFIDLTKYFDDLGITMRDIYAPQSDDKNENYREAQKGNDTLIEEDLKFLVENFIANVKTYRSGRIRMQEKEPFTGKMYNAGDAVRIGLIDGIKPLPAAVKRLEQLIALRA